MNAATREQLCRQAVVDKRRLGLGLEDVRRIDDFFQRECGIVSPLPLPAWMRKLRQLAGRNFAATYQSVHDEYASFIQTGEDVPISLQNQFYDVLADKRIAGHVHSQKRTEILDAGCFLLYLVRLLQITGPILDVGCHTGHHAIMLARETGSAIRGIDLSTKAIAAAQTESRGATNVTFSTDPLATPDFSGMFELVYAVRSIDLNQESAALVAAALKPGGIAVFFPHAPPFFEKRESAEIFKAGLGWLFADVVGGFIGPERGFEAGSAIVLIKGGDKQPPKDGVSEATSGWAAFSKYANDPTTPAAEKTQAYFRAHWQQSHPYGG